MVSHFGPPTAASRTASASAHAASTSSVRRSRGRRCSPRRKCALRTRTPPPLPRTSSAAAMTSGPIPSPGRASRRGRARARRATEGVAGRRPQAARRGRASASLARTCGKFAGRRPGTDADPRLSLPWLGRARAGPGAQTRSLPTRFAIVAQKVVPGGRRLCVSHPVCGLLRASSGTRPDFGRMCVRGGQAGYLTSKTPLAAEALR